MFHFATYHALSNQDNLLAYHYLSEALEEALLNPDYLLTLTQGLEALIPSHILELSKLSDDKGRTYLHRSVMAKSLKLTELFLQYTNPFIVDNAGYMALHYSPSVEFKNLFINQQCLITHKPLFFNALLQIRPRVLFIGDIEYMRQYRHRSIISDEKTLSSALKRANSTEIELFNRRFTEFTEQHHHSTQKKLNILSQLIEKCFLPLLNQQPFNKGELIIPPYLNFINYADYNAELNMRLDLFDRAKIIFTTYRDERERILQTPIQNRVVKGFNFCFRVSGIVCLLAIVALIIWTLMSGAIFFGAYLISPSFRFPEVLQTIWEGVYWMLAIGAMSTLLFSLGTGVGGIIIECGMHSYNRLIPSFLAQSKTIEDIYIRELLALLGGDARFDTIFTVLRNKALSFHERIINIDKVVSEEKAELTKAIEHADKKVPQSINLSFFKTSKKTGRTMKSSNKTVETDIDCLTINYG